MNNPKRETQWPGHPAHLAGTDPEPERRRLLVECIDLLKKRGLNYLRTVAADLREALTVMQDELDALNEKIRDIVAEQPEDVRTALLRADVPVGMPLTLDENDAKTLERPAAYEQAPKNIRLLVERKMQERRELRRTVYQLRQRLAAVWHVRIHAHMKDDRLPDADETARKIARQGWHLYDEDAHDNRSALLSAMAEDAAVQRILDKDEPPDVRTLQRALGALYPKKTTGSGRPSKDDERRLMQRMLSWWKRL